MNSRDILSTVPHRPQVKLYTPNNVRTPCAVATLHSQYTPQELGNWWGLNACGWRWCALFDIWFLLPVGNYDHNFWLFQLCGNFLSVLKVYGRRFVLWITATSSEQYKIPLFLFTLQPSFIVTLQKKRKTFKSSHYGFIDFQL